MVESILHSLQELPDDFKPLPKFNRILKRAQELIDKRLIDWSMGEHLAYGSLLVEGTGIRMSGQDVKRGTSLIEMLCYMMLTQISSTIVE